MTGKIRRLIGTPNQAKRTFNKIVKEEVDNHRRDEVAAQRQKKQGGGKK